jgi:WhiB family redox-sensing transcriptional regulator
VLLPLRAPSTKRWCSERCKVARRKDPWRAELEAVSEPPDDQELDADLVPWLMTPEVSDPEPGLLGVPAAWFARAACRGMPVETFVPTGKSASLDAARRVCAGCPVRVECLAYALADPDLDRFGVFGGLTARERRQLSRHADAA